MHSFLLILGQNLAAVFDVLKETVSSTLFTAYLTTGSNLPQFSFSILSLFPELFSFFFLVVYKV